MGLAIDEPGCGWAWLWMDLAVDRPGCGPAWLWTSLAVDGPDCGLAWLWMPLTENSDLPFAPAGQPRAIGLWWGNLS